MNPRPYLFFYDFFYLWAAGNLTLHGQNPYDLQLYSSKLYEIGWPSYEAVTTFPHPPWALWIYMIMGSMPFALAKWVWLLLNVLILFFCSKLLYTNYELYTGSKRKLPPQMFILAILSFPSVYKILIWGQVSLIGFAGLVFFLYFYQQKKFTYSGLVLSLTFIKPHLLFVFYAALLAVIIRNKNYKIPLGFLAGIGLQLGICLFFLPDAVGNFISAVIPLFGEAALFPGPTLGQVLAIHSDLTWAREVLIAVGILTGLYIGFTSKNINNLTLITIPISLLFTPYCWSHAFIFLIPTYLAVVSFAFESIGRSFRYFLFTLAAFSSYVGPKAQLEQLMIFIPILILLGSLVLWEQQKKELLKN